MQCKVGTSFTGTEGAGNQIQKSFVFDFDIERCPYLNDEAITNIGMYKEKASRQSQVQILPKLERLKSALERIYSNQVDPIEYLLYLYYRDELTTEQIARRTTELDFGYKTKNGIQKLFKDTFKWELRDQHDITERRKRRLSSPNNPSNIGLQKKREELWRENAEIFRSSLLSVVNNTQTVRRKFSEDDFRSYKIKSEKIFYLLDVFEGISFKYLCGIAHNTGMGGASLARIINEKLKQIHIKNPVVPELAISPAMLHLLLKKAGIKT